MTCRQLFRRLSEFLDGELPPNLCEQIRAHIARCAPCHVFVRSLEATVRLCHELPPAPLPEEVRHALQERLRAEWQKRFAHEA